MPRRRARPSRANSTNYLAGMLNGGLKESEAINKTRRKYSADFKTPLSEAPRPVRQGREEITRCRLLPDAARASPAWRVSRRRATLPGALCPLPECGRTSGKRTASGRVGTKFVPTIFYRWGGALEHGSTPPAAE